MSILPFRPILTDLAANFWHLRAFFLLLFLFVLLNGVLLYVAEAIVGRASHGLPFWLGLAADDIFPPKLIDYDTTTASGAVVRKVNGFLGYVLLGLIFHAIRESFQQHRLRKSRLVFFATDEETR